MDCFFNLVIDEHCNSGSICKDNFGRSVSVGLEFVFPSAFLVYFRGTKIELPGLRVILSGHIHFSISNLMFSRPSVIFGSFLIQMQVLFLLMFEIIF